MHAISACNITCGYFFHTSPLFNYFCCYYYVYYGYFSVAYMVSIAEYAELI